MISCHRTGDSEEITESRYPVSSDRGLKSEVPNKKHECQPLDGNIL